jgi:hypothetical protein
MTLLQRALTRVARLLLGDPPPTPPSPQRRRSEDRMPAYIPDTNPLEEPPAAELRSEHAMMLMDEDVYGYLLLTVHRHQEGLRADIRASEQILPGWWPAISEALTRLASATRR